MCFLAKAKDPDAQSLHSGYCRRMMGGLHNPQSVTDAGVNVALLEECNALLARCAVNYTVVTAYGYKMKALKCKTLGANC